MVQIIKKFNKYIVGFLAIGVFLCPLALKAQDTDDIKNQFISLGGSENGYKTILQVVEKSRSFSETLNASIKEKYNQSLFNAMVAGNFDEKYYTKIYNDMQAEKQQLVQKNLSDMINLLKSLSLEDRKAYAQLLYGIDKEISDSAQNNATSDSVQNQKNDNSVSSNSSREPNSTDGSDVSLPDDAVNSATNIDNKAKEVDTAKAAQNN